MEAHPATAHATGVKSRPLAPYRKTPIDLFIADPGLAWQLAQAMEFLPFTQVSTTQAADDFLKAQGGLLGLLLRTTGLVLVNHPALRKKDRYGRQYRDYDFPKFYGDLSRLIARTGHRPEDLLSRCIPVLEAPLDHDLRRGIIEDLFGLGLTGVFPLQVMEAGRDRKTQVRDRCLELHDYFLDYFRCREGKVRDLEQFGSAGELRAACQEADRLLKGVAREREAGNYQEALTLCHRVGGALPGDPAPFVQAARLLVKQRRYPPALEMLRHAERAAAGGPTPFLESGKVRVAKALAMLDGAAAPGGEIDHCLVQAANSFQLALERAAARRAVTGNGPARVRRAAVLDVAREILGLELGRVLGEDNPHWRRMVSMVDQSLDELKCDRDRMPAAILISLGLNALYEGDLDRADRMLGRAMSDASSREEACRRMNQAGLRLTADQRPELAMAVLEKLLAHDPPGQGRILLNLAEARQCLADKRAEQDPALTAAHRRTAAATATKALYLETGLDREDFRSVGPAILPCLRWLAEVYRAALAGAPPEPKENARACWEARVTLDDLLAGGRNRQALEYLFKLAGEPKEFFLLLAQYASRPILEFVRHLHPQLRGHASARIQAFGMMLGLLLSRGQRTLGADHDHLHPHLKEVTAALDRGRPLEAAAELTLAFWDHPTLHASGCLAQNAPALMLCREMHQRLDRLDLARFSRHQGAAAA